MYVDNCNGAVTGGRTMVMGQYSVFFQDTALREKGKMTTKICVSLSWFFYHLCVERSEIKAIRARSQTRRAIPGPSSTVKCVILQRK